MIKRDYPYVEGVQVFHLFAQDREINALRDIARDSAVDDWQRGRQELSDYYKTNLGEYPQWIAETYGNASQEYSAFTNLRQRMLTALKASSRAESDAYLVYIPPGSSVLEHIDPAPAGQRHVRANLILESRVSAMSGRANPFYVIGPGGKTPIWMDVGDCAVFCSSEVRHGVSDSLGGQLLFSVGALVPK
jgi:hypothetical protein